MAAENILVTVLSVLFYTILISVLFRKLNLSSILGYLFAGVILGKSGIGLISYQDVDQLGEYGVVFLLFTVGLEVSLERLKSMWKYVFGLGILQMLICTILLTTVMFIITSNFKLSLLLSSGLALSSTAIVMQILKDTHNTNNSIGRAGVSILLLQDLMVILILVLIPMCIDDSQSIFDLSKMIINTLIKTLFILICIFLVGRLILQPIFVITSSNKLEINHEVFIATTITTALSIGYLTHLFGLSMELGAFIAGMLIAETEFQHAAESSIAPFKGLLLGIFFISVGTKIDILFVVHNIIYIVLLAIGIICIKGVVITFLSYMFNLKKHYSGFIGILLSQSSEFAFIILDKLYDSRLLDAKLNNIVLSAVVVTMILTPLLISIVKNLLLQSHQSLKEIQLETEDLTDHIIIVGFNKTAKMLTSIFQYKNIQYAGIEMNKSKKIDDRCIFNGDGTKIHFLKAMNIQNASCLIVNLSNTHEIKVLVNLVKKYYPNISIIVTNVESIKYVKSLGVDHIIHQGYESGLQTAKVLLSNIGMDNIEINNLTELIRSSEYNIPQQTLTIKHEDESNITNNIKSKKKKS